MWLLIYMNSVKRRYSLCLLWYMSDCKKKMKWFLAGITFLVLFVSINENCWKWWEKFQPFLWLHTLYMPYGNPNIIRNAHDFSSNNKYITYGNIDYRDIILLDRLKSVLSRYFYKLLLNDFILECTYILKAHYCGFQSPLIK